MTLGFSGVRGNTLDSNRYVRSPSGRRYEGRGEEAKTIRQKTRREGSTGHVSMRTEERGRQKGAQSPTRSE